VYAALEMQCQIKGGNGKTEPAGFTRQVGVRNQFKAAYALQGEDNHAVMIELMKNEAPKGRPNSLSRLA
jgi:hypothetical protein